MGRTFLSLKHRNYRIWFFASLVANTGTWMQFVAQDWVVLTELTNDNALAVGLVAALQQTPALLFLPFTGLLADRFDKRKIMLGTQVTLSLLAFLMAFLVLTDRLTVWQMCVIAFVTGTVSAIDSPSRAVFVSELVPAEDLPNAVGLNSTSFNLARLIGPGVAGVLIAAVGSGWAFLINGASFVATIVALLAMRSSEFHVRSRVPEPGGAGKKFAEGLRYLKTRGDLVVIFVVAGTVSCLCMNYQLTTAAMARIEFGLEAGEYGILGSILGIGSLVGALMAARRRKSPRVRTIVVAAALCGVASAINSAMPTYWSYAISLTLCGFTMLLLFTSANTLVQVSTDSNVRGRVMSLFQTVMMGTAPIGSLIVSWLCDSVSPRWGIGIGAVASFLVVLGAYFWGRNHWGVQVSYSMRSRPHFNIVGPLELEQRRRDEEVAREVAIAQGDRTPSGQPR